MKETGCLKREIYSLLSEVNNLHSYLSNEVYSGDWKDEVGKSFLDYVEQLARSIGNLTDFTNNLASVEDNIDAINDKKDETAINNLEASVNRL